MVFTVQSCALVGLKPFSVQCEVDLSLQLPSFTLVGLPSSITQESRDRVRAAIVNSGIEWPSKKVTVNMVPTQLPKWGSHYELAMALGILGSTLEPLSSPNIFAVGELSLTGNIRPTGWLGSLSHWILERKSQTSTSLYIFAHPHDIEELQITNSELSVQCIFCPVLNILEALVSLKEVISNSQESNVGEDDYPQLALQNCKQPSLDILKQVEGEKLATIAALLAISNKYHVLFAGPHGMGKSMLIRAICEATLQLLPSQKALRNSVLKMFGEQFLFTYSEKNKNNPKPTVELQTTMSRAALEGSVLTSGQIIPGALTQAHCGILVADELLEYRRDVIECLRQPIEEKVVRLQRAKFSAVLPADFQLLASTNLCKCGYFGTARKLCRCSVKQLQEYQKKLSGPIMDRFDLFVIVGRQDEECIPKHLQKIVDDFLNVNLWESRIQNVSNSTASILESSQFGRYKNSPRFSRRGFQKLIKIADSIANFLNQPVCDEYFQLAELMRQDLNSLAYPSISSLQVILRKANKQGIISTR